MEKDYLTLKRASASRSSGDWNDDDFDVLAEGIVVGRISKVHAAPVGTPWMLPSAAAGDALTPASSATARQKRGRVFSERG
jgi:hypothetical protein